MPAPAPDSPRQGRSVLKLSLGISLLAVATIIAVVFVAGAPEADAASCTWTVGGGGNWTTPTNWQQPGCGGTYPGAGSGDSASFSFPPSTPVIVDSPITNSVVLNLTSFGGDVVNIPSAGALTIEP